MLLYFEVWGAVCFRAHKDLFKGLFKGVFLACFVWGAQGLMAQDSVHQYLLDEVLATIGDKIILSSEIHNEISDMKQRGMEVPLDAACSFLEQAIATKAMQMQAVKDSLLVSDDEVDAELETRIRYYINLYGGKNELEQIAGRNIFQMKEDFREPIREGLLARNMQKKIMDGVKVTPAEVLTFFEKRKKEDKLDFYELEVEIAQVILYPKANKEAEEYAMETLKELKKRVEDGAKFEKLAVVYSDDPGSRQNGGYYELNKNEKQWDPVFLATAFRLKPGKISPVVRSKFGYHIIQMISRYGDNAAVRHILKIPSVREEDVAKTMEQAKKIVQDIRKGTLLFERAVALYSEDESSSFTGGFLMNKDRATQLTINDLDRSIIPYIEKLKVGDYSDPILFTDERGKVGIRILYLKSKIPPHRENLRDDYLKIVNKLTEEKRNDQLRLWLENKVANFYLHVAPKYKNCNATIKQWEEQSDKIGSLFSSGRK